MSDICEWCEKPIDDCICEKSVDLWEVRKWDCPVCGETNEEPGSSTASDVTCSNCEALFKVDGVYSD